MKKFIMCLLCGMLIFMTACDTSKPEDNTDIVSKYPNNYADIDEGTVNSEGITWLNGHLLPTFAPAAESLDAIEVSQSKDLYTLAVTFQGLINRKQPRVLILNSNAGEGKETWAKEFGLSYTKEKDIYKVIEKYKSEIKGIVIYDTKLNDTINVATTIAGVEDGIVVSPKLAEKLTAEPFNFPVIKDLRGMFTDRLEAYDFAYNEYFSKCDKRIFTGADPETNVGIRDLAVAAKAFTIWLDPTNPEDKEHVKKYFAQTEAGKGCYTGWWKGEVKGVAAASEFGIPTIPSDYYENYSVFSSLSKEIEIPEVPEKPKLENKLYVALVFSDGDNIQYNQHHMKSNSLWGSSKRGSVPIGWTISPMLLDAGPQMMNYYYKNATDMDCFISGPSGAGYMTVQNCKDEVLFDEFAKNTDTYFRKTNQKVITIWDTLGDMQGNSYSKYTKSLYGLFMQNGENKVYGETSSTPFTSNYAASIDDIKMNIEILSTKVDGTKPIFHAFQGVAWNMGYNDMQKMAASILKDLEDKVVFVRPDHFMMLQNEANGVPYNVALRGNVSSSQGENTESLVDGSFTNGWSAESENWISIDLGAEYKISRYVLKHAETAYMDKGLNTKDYKIQASSDNETWTDIEEVKGNTSSITDKNVDLFTAQYVRVLILNAGTDGIARVQEFELYGNKA